MAVSAQIGRFRLGEGDVVVALRQDDGRAFARATGGDAEADAGGAAGDDDDFVTQASVHVPWSVQASRANAIAVNTFTTEDTE